MRILVVMNYDCTFMRIKDIVKKVGKEGLPAFSRPNDEGNPEMAATFGCINNNEYICPR
jgi:hypothetical protein